MLLSNFQTASEWILFNQLTQAQNPFIWSQIGCLPLRSKPKQQCNLPYLLYISGFQGADLASTSSPWTLGHTAQWAFSAGLRKLTWSGKFGKFQKTNKAIASIQSMVLMGGCVYLKSNHGIIDVSDRRSGCWQEERPSPKRSIQGLLPQYPWQALAKSVVCILLWPLCLFLKVSLRVL